MDGEHDDTTLAERLAARFARLHPETAHRLRARAAGYCHRPLADPWPTPVVPAQPGRPDLSGSGADLPPG